VGDFLSAYNAARLWQGGSMADQLLLARGWRSQGIKYFVRRHKKSVFLLAAFIVFATFIVRDNVREHYHDVASAIQSAQSVFAMRSGIVQMDIDLGLIKNRLTKLEDLLNEMNNPNGPHRVIKTMTLEHGYTTTQITAELAEHVNIYSLVLVDLERLIAVLPNNRAEKERLLKLQQQLDHRRLLVRDTGRLFYLGAEGPSDEITQLRKRISEEEHTVAADDAPEKNLLSYRMEEFQLNVMRRATREGDYYESLDKVWYWLSIGLYSLGWALGLIGHFYGSEELVQE
jgi:hypothetical protein